VQERANIERDMTRITITQAAFDAIAATMPFGNVGCEAPRMGS